MNIVTLKKLALTNFKGFAKTEKYFGQREEIFAENGQGKTTLRDAWFWVLGFNVNDVIPSRDNREIPNLEIKVEAEITINTSVGDYDYIFTREQREVRKTNKDTGKEEKVNNESIYLIDNTPFTLKNYKDKIAELFGVPYEKLQMLCIKEFFNTDNGEKWKWSHRRKELFDICHVDTAIADIVRKEEYALIAPDIAKRLSTADIKKAIKRELTGYANDKERNATLIADKKNDISKYGNTDFDGLEAERTVLENKITQITLSASKQEPDEEIVNAKRQRGALETRLFNIQSETRRKTSEVNEKLSFLMGEMRKVQAKGEALKGEMKTAQSDIKSLEESNAQLEQQTWKGATVCPTCGQPIPQDKIDESKKNFEEKRTASIAQNNESIDKKIDFLDNAKTQLAELRDTYATLASQKGEYEKQLEELQKPNKEVGALNQQISDLNELIESATKAESEESDLTSLLEPLRKRVQEINGVLSYKRVVADLNARVEQLMQANRDLTDKEMLAKQKMKQIDSYVREQEKLVTEIINSKFGRGVSFSLFSELYAGSEHETKEECICMLNGKTYNEMSYGERFFADLEVTATLQAEYGVLLPIFLDNAECYTGDVEAQQQLILLYAKKGAFLDGVKIEVLL